MNIDIINDAAARHDFVILFDVTDGNPNGDPDAGNLPRVDPETMQGLVTDVCLKRKIRNWVDLNFGITQRFKIYVQSKEALNAIHQRAYDETGLKSTGTKQKRAEIDIARKWMCDNFFDVRTFGAVMSTEVNCGQVRGPIQLTFARSFDQIVPMDVTITRIAITRPKDMESVIGEEGEETGKSKVTEMGRKAIVPYGLYRGFGFFNPNFAAQTGFDSEDLKIFWSALQNMWDIDRSASRGMMALRGLYIFSHENPLGNGHAHELFDRLNVQLKDGIESPRSFNEYAIDWDDSPLPEGVTLTKLVGQ
jgi:CRISPR-associated protein Csd2